MGATKNDFHKTKPKLWALSVLMMLVCSSTGVSTDTFY